MAIGTRGADREREVYELRRDREDGLGRGFTLATDLERGGGSIYAAGLDAGALARWGEARSSIDLDERRLLEDAAEPWARAVERALDRWQTPPAPPRDVATSARMMGVGLVGLLGVHLAMRLADQLAYRGGPGAGEAWARRVGLLR